MYIYICIYLHIYVSICIHSYLRWLDHFSTVRVPPKLLVPFQKRAQACTTLLQTRIDTSGGFWIIATRLFDGNGQERIRKRGRRVHMREHGTCVCVYVCVCVCVFSCSFARACLYWYGCASSRACTRAIRKIMGVKKSLGFD